MRVGTDTASPPAGDPAGRAGYLARLDSVVTQVRHGTPVLVEVVGEPGIGKSHLLKAAALRVRTSELPVLAGGGDPTTQDRAFALTNALFCAAGERPNTGRDDIDETDRRFRLILHRLRSRPGGAVLLLDDLHFADAASLEVLARLLRVPPDGLAVVAVYRPRQNVRAIGAALGSAVGMRREVIELPGLTQPELAELLAVEPGPVVAAVHRLTGGNPLYAHAYRHARPGDRALVDGVLDRLPADVARAMHREITALPEEEQRAAYAVAVLGDGCDLAAAPAMAQLDPQRFIDLLDRLVVRDLLRAQPDGRCGVRFRHPVVRAAVYSTIPPGRRRRLHAAAARLLREAGHPPVSLARHLVRSADPGDVAAARALRRAAAHAGVPKRTAIAWLSTARGVLPEHPGVDELRAQVDLDLAALLVATGRLREGHALLQDLACRRPTDDDEQGVRLALARAEVERLLGQPHRAYALLTAELSESPPSDSAAALLTAEAALAAALCGRGAAGEHLAAVRRLVRSSNPRIECRVRAVEAFLAAWTGDVDGAADALTRTATVIDAMPDGNLVDMLDTMSLLGWAELLCEQDREALRHFDQGLALAARGDHQALRPYLLAGRCCAAARLGNLCEALRDGLEAEEVAGRLGVESVRMLAGTLRAEIVRHQAGPAAARRLAQAAASHANAWRPDWLTEMSHRRAAAARHLCGDPTDGQTALLRACGDAELGRVPASHRSYWAGVLADMARDAGDRDRAASWVEEAGRHAKVTPLPGQRAYAALAQARHEVSEDADAAAELAGAAAETFARLGWPLDEASARLLCAEALGARRKWRRAESELAKVRQLATRTGSQALHLAAVAEQRRTVGRAGRLAVGKAPHRRDLDLTRREWDVVRLVIAGVSNAEVANRLYVTVKTVEAHLTRIFRKLGVSSRVGLVAALSPMTFDSRIPADPDSWL
ncbi:MAG TPA: AAA family ATPase [Pilimelia sp.]|nr:AAA family ATPase [Pilimelia sp.]